VEIQLLECIKRCYYATLRHRAPYSCYAPATRFTNITTILRLSYDNANVTIDLRRTSNSPYKTSYERRKAFLRYDSLAKSSEIVFVNSAHCQATQQANHSQQAAAASLNMFVSVHALLKRQCYGNLCSPDQWEPEAMKKNKSWLTWLNKLWILNTVNISTILGTYVKIVQETITTHDFFLSKLILLFEYTPFACRLLLGITCKHDVIHNTGST